jgi:hypothetical protein
MEDLNLEEITPEGAEFTLKATGKTYRMRPFGLEDERWLRKTFGERIKAIMKQVDMDEIARIVFHQLEPDDQMDFVRRPVKFVSEDGAAIEKQLGGVDLLRQCIRGNKEKIAIYQALLETIGLSRGVQEKIISDAVEQSEAEKKRLIGPQSSTSSPQSTDGPPTTSGS